MKAWTKYRALHRELGLCSICPEPVVDGKSRCEYHTRTNNEKQARYRARKRLDRAAKCT